jgi:mevalonate kinase
LFKASAPGSLMLLGEHAVLHGKQALVCAIDKRITVTLIPRSDTKIEIISTVLGKFTTDLSNLVVIPPFHFLLAILKKNQSVLKTGCTIIVEAEFSDKVGFGSSAAVTVAILAALYTWLNRGFSPTDLIREARAIVRKVQGLGSGADIAACVLGGVIAYKMQPLQIEKLAYQPLLTAVYAGYKTPTVEVVKQVTRKFISYPKLFKQLCQAIDTCVTEGITAVKQQNWDALGQLMNVQQGLLDALGVSTLDMSKIIDGLRQQKTILGAKISGSGLGDCIVGLGTIPADYSPEQNGQGIQLIPIEISTRGVYCEKS